MQNRAEVLLYNKCFGDAKELVEQFMDVSYLNPKLSKPVLHIALSLAPEDQLRKDKLMEMCEHCAKEIGFENNQYMAVYHRDTNHQHLHIIANRVGFDKHTVSDSNNYQRISSYCRKMELKYQLKQVLSPRRYLSQQQRNIPRHDQRKERLREDVKQVLSKSGSYHEFEQQMKEKGYAITKGRGILFTDEKKVKVKGSELGYSLQTIERILGKQNLLRNTLTRKYENRNDLQSNQQFSKELNLEDRLKEGILNTMEQLMKPEGRTEQIDPHLQKPKQKKKQYRSHHL